MSECAFVSSESFASAYPMPDMRCHNGLGRTAWQGAPDERTRCMTVLYPWDTLQSAGSGFASLPAISLLSSCSALWVGCNCAEPPLGRLNVHV